MDREYGDARYQSRFVEDCNDGFAGYRLARTRFGETKDVAQVTYWDAAGQFYFQTFGEEDGRLSAFVRDRYANWDSAFGKQAAAVLSLQDIAEHALGSKHQVLPASGRQEYLENLINRFV